MKPEVDVSMSTGVEPMAATEEHQQMQGCAERTEETTITMREEAWRRMMERFAQQRQREHQRRVLVEAARAIRDAAREAEVALLRAATEDGEPALGDVVQRLCDLHMTVARASVRIDRFESLKDALTIAVRELETKREEA